MAAAEETSARRIELILQQVEALPTLPTVAMRLLQITAAEDSDARQVIQAVKADASLTAKILKLCRAAGTTVSNQTLTIDQAVVLLGFASIRNAVLSIKVFESFAGDQVPTDGKRTGAFDRAGFWRHSLAVAVASELIAARHSELGDIEPAQAFVCGLLHDIGKLALEHVLPKSYSRVIELTEQSTSNIAQIERRVLGIDHHTAGKRLAEKWGLGHQLADVIWLHGSPYASLPNLPHRRMVGLIGLADAHVRALHIGYSGNHKLADDLPARAVALGLDPQRVHAAVQTIGEQLEKRASALGLGTVPDRKVFLESIMQANELLGRLNAQLELQQRRGHRQSKALSAISQFHDAARQNGSSVSDAISNVIRSASAVLGEGRYAIVYQPSGQREWQISQYNADGRVVRSQLVDPPHGFDQLAEVYRRDEVPVGWMSVLPWLSDYLVGFADVRKVHMLPLACAWGTAAVLVHEQLELPAAEQLAALTLTWGAAIAAATQHEGARRLGEQLAQANRELTEAQDSLLHHESMARLGEMAAGAAHEMNNPLAVISGRAQLLSMKLASGSREQADATLIFEQAQKLSDLITALHLFAEPPRPAIASVSIQKVMTLAVNKVRAINPQAPAAIFNPPADLPVLQTDPDHLASVLAELMLNAHESESSQSIQIVAQVDPLDDRFIIKVIDMGKGMDAHTLAHAFDPFFSAKQAGRKPGLGLSKARRLIEGLGGKIELISQPGRGSTATVELPLWDIRGEIGAEAAAMEAADAGRQEIQPAGESRAVNAASDHRN